MAERILQAALEVDGFVFTAPPPARHHTLMHEWYRLTRQPQSQRHVQGFLTTEGRFVTRAEAKRLAFDSGQVSGRLISGGTRDAGGIITSEDLW